MFIQKEIALRNFEPWSGAKAVFNRLTTDELDMLDEILSYDEKPMTETEINDMFWFDDDFIFDTLSIDPEEFWKREE